MLFMSGQPEAPSRPPSQAPLLPEAEQQMLQDLMSEAMEEADSQHILALQRNGETTYNHNYITFP